MTERQALLATVVAMLTALARLSIHVWELAVYSDHPNTRARPSISRQSLLRGYPILLAVAIITPCAIASGATVFRAVVAVMFVFLVPGAAVVGYFAIRDPLDHLVLAVATSLTALSATSLAMLYAHVWRPRLLVVSLALLSTWALTRHALRPAQPNPSRRGPEQEGQ